MRILLTDRPLRFVLLLAPVLALGGCGGGAPTANSPAIQLPGAESEIGVTQSGEGTYYAATGAGSCSYDAAPESVMVAAINAAQYLNGQACGMCVEVGGPKGRIVVRIVDLCPECKAGDLDLSEQAFVMIAEKRAGRVPITWVPVACSVQGPIAMRFKEGSSQWWLAVQVRNSRLPIRRIEMLTPAAFVVLEQQNYNYAINDNDPGPGPFTLRITAVDGQQVTETGVPLREGAVTVGTQQFQ